MSAIAIYLTDSFEPLARSHPTCLASEPSQRCRLESELQRELDLPRRLRLEDLSEERIGNYTGCVVERIVLNLPYLRKRLAEVRSVKQIEEFNSELNVFPFREASVLQYGKIEINQVRTVKGVSPQ